MFGESKEEATISKLEKQLQEIQEIKKVMEDLSERVYNLNEEFNTEILNQKDIDTSQLVPLVSIILLMVRDVTKSKDSLELTEYNLIEKIKRCKETNCKKKRELIF